MLVLNSFFHILEWKIPNQADWQSLVSVLTARSDKIYARIIDEFGPNGLLVVGLFVLFLVMIVIIYVKVVFDTLHQEKEDVLDEYISEINQEEAAAQIEAEKELSLSLVAASENSDDFLGVGEDYERLKKSMQKYAKIQQQEFNSWRDKAESKVISATRIRSMEIVSLIIKMLARQVSEPKIAQTLANRLQLELSNEFILQIVRSVRDFIGLANAKMFAELPQAASLPKPADALKLLCEKGDNSLCLELLQKLTSQYVEDATEEKGIARQLLLAQAANYACLTGNFAALDDMELALTSYNFATEISSESVTAWNDLGNAYMAQNNEMKAMFAYQAVMELADPYMYEAQIANAKKHLAAYFQKHGVENKASEFAADAAKYYENYGLQEPLTILEEAAADHIISRQDIRESLEILLPLV